MNAELETILSAQADQADAMAEMRLGEPGPARVSVPREALALSLGPLTFKDAQPDATGKVPVALTIRTAKAVDHWYWGRIIHDLAGMTKHKDSLPIDYAHDDDQVLGYMDRFDVNDEAIYAEGYLVPFEDGDRASEVIHKAKQGVPYEASIYMGGPLALEEIQEGATAEVNGETVDGPVLIVRQWSLRGTAICPYGADRHTQTKFSQTHTIDVEYQMPKKTPPATPAPDADKLNDKPTDPPADPTPPVDDQLTNQPTDPPEDRKELARFVDAFGAEKGAGWYLAGRQFAECQAEAYADAEKRAATVTEEMAAMAVKLTETEAKLSETEAKLEATTKELDKYKAAFDRGEEKPAAFAEDDDSPEAAEHRHRVNTLGENLAKVAGGMKLKKTA